MTAPVPFFVVWRPSGYSPVVQHSTFEIAEREAKRLARQTPGEPFFVLAAVARVEKIDVGVTRFFITDDPDDDGIPF